GRCHVFGDDVPLDDGLIPFEMAIGRVDAPEQLTPELFKMIDPTFPQRVQPGDIVIAGRNSACANQHFQGFIALPSWNMSIICESIPYKSLRGAISKCVPVLSGVHIEKDQFVSGDEVEVDFGTGEILNLTRNLSLTAPPLSSELLKIIQQGGPEGMLRRWL